MKRAPILTLTMAAGAVAIALMPDVSGWLIYDRTAIVSGQIWRLFAGHWVHLSHSHLILDVVAFGIAGSIIETQRLPGYGWLCAFSPGFIGVALLIFEPQMNMYGGLSGLAAASLVYLAVWGLTNPSPWRWVCAVTLVGVVAKMTFEASTERAVFAAFESGSVVPSTTSHIAGAVSALLVYGAVAPRRIIRGGRRQKIEFPSRSARPQFTE